MSREPCVSEDEAALAAMNSELRQAVEEARSSLCQALHDAHAMLDLLRAGRGIGNDYRPDHSDPSAS